MDVSPFFQSPPAYFLRSLLCFWRTNAVHTQNVVLLSIIIVCSRVFSLDHCRATKLPSPPPPIPFLLYYSLLRNFYIIFHTRRRTILFFSFAASGSSISVLATIGPPPSLFNFMTHTKRRGKKKWINVAIVASFYSSSVGSLSIFHILLLIFSSSPLYNNGVATSSPPL